MLVAKNDKRPASKAWLLFTGTVPDIADFSDCLRSQSMNDTRPQLSLESRDDGLRMHCVDLVALQEYVSRKLGGWALIFAEIKRTKIEARVKNSCFVLEKEDILYDGPYQRYFWRWRKEDRFDSNWPAVSGEKPESLVPTSLIFLDPIEIDSDELLSGRQSKGDCLAEHFWAGHFTSKNLLILPPSKPFADDDSYFSRKRVEERTAIRIRLDKQLRASPCVLSDAWKIADRPLMGDPQLDGAELEMLGNDNLPTRLVLRWPEPESSVARWRRAFLRAGKEGNGASLGAEWALDIAKRVFEDLQQGLSSVEFGNSHPPSGTWNVAPFKKDVPRLKGTWESIRWLRDLLLDNTDKADRAQPNTSELSTILTETAWGDETVDNDKAEEAFVDRLCRYRRQPETSWRLAFLDMLDAFRSGTLPLDENDLLSGGHLLTDLPGEPEQRLLRYSRTGIARTRLWRWLLPIGSVVEPRTTNIVDDEFALLDEDFVLDDEVSLGT